VHIFSLTLTCRQSPVFPLPFFAELPPGAWDRRGIASGNPFSVRALVYIIAGHVEHHLALLEERYL